MLRPLPAPSQARSGRPAWPSSRSSQAVAASPSRVRAHSAYASPAQRVFGIATSPSSGRLGASMAGLRPGSVTDGYRSAPGAVFSQTETCLVLSLVNGSRRQPLQRSRSRIPASRAIRSSSAGHT
jgi:hypothetical protein